MNGRKRTVQIKFRVTEEERALIEEKMKLIPTRNMSADLRKIAIDGYIIQVDHTDKKTMTAAMQNIGVNVNQIARLAAEIHGGNNGHGCDRLKARNRREQKTSDHRQRHHCSYKYHLLGIRSAVLEMQKERKAGEHCDAQSKICVLLITEKQRSADNRCGYEHAENDI